LKTQDVCFARSICHFACVDQKSVVMKRNTGIWDCWARRSSFIHFSGWDK